MGRADLMSDAYLGIVRLPWAGDTIPLQFTLRRVAEWGRAGLIDKLTLIAEGGEGDGEALADLLELASGGEIVASDVIDTTIGMDRAVVALHAAWALARFGPSGKPEDERAENPLQRLQTSFVMLWRRVRGRG